MDSLVFKVTSEKAKVIDTFTVRSRKVALDSLQLNASQNGSLNFNDPFYIGANIPLTALDTTKITMMDQDSVPVAFTTELDTLKNKVDFDFKVEPNQNYQLDLLPGAITDLFGETNDTIAYNLSTQSYADLGNLKFNIQADSTSYPLIVELTDEQGTSKRKVFATDAKPIEFNNIEPAKYFVRVIFDTNGNQKWDTGNYLKQKAPEKVSHYPDTVEVRANWELEETFTIRD